MGCGTWSKPVNEDKSDAAKANKQKYADEKQVGDDGIGVDDGRDDSGIDQRVRMVRFADDGIQEVEPPYEDDGISPLGRVEKAEEAWRNLVVNNERRARVCIGKRINDNIINAMRERSERILSLQDHFWRSYNAACMEIKSQESDERQELIRRRNAQFGKKSALDTSAMKERLRQFDTKGQFDLHEGHERSARLVLACEEIREMKCIKTEFHNKRLEAMHKAHERILLQRASISMLPPSQKSQAL